MNFGTETLVSAKQVEVGAKGCLFQPTSSISKSVRFRQHDVLPQMGRVMKMHKLKDMRDLLNLCQCIFYHQALLTANSYVFSMFLVPNYPRFSR